MTIPRGKRNWFDSCLSGDWTLGRQGFAEKCRFLVFKSNSCEKGEAHTEKENMKKINIK